MDGINDFKDLDRLLVILKYLHRYEKSPDHWGYSKTVTLFKKK